MSIQNKLKNLYEALSAVSTDLTAYHYFAPSNTSMPYIVWYEESESSSLQAENHKQEQAVSGWVEFYTRTEFDPLFDEIQSTLNSIEGLGWTYQNTIYGDPQSDNNNSIHHSWSWRIS